MYTDEVEIIDFHNIDKYMERMFVLAFNMDNKDLQEISSGLNNILPTFTFRTNDIKQNNKNINKKRIPLLYHCFCICIIENVLKKEYQYFQQGVQGLIISTSLKGYLQFISKTVNNAKFEKFRKKNLKNHQLNYMNTVVEEFKKILKTDMESISCTKRYELSREAKENIKDFFQKNKIPYRDFNLYLYFMFFYMFILILGLIYFVFFFEVF